MNGLEKKMVGILKTLRENYGVTAVKVNMEAEGIRLEEILKTKDIVLSAGVELTVKIGGCEAVTDMRLSRIYGVNTVMGPMIESTFRAGKIPGDGRIRIRRRGAQRPQGGDQH